MPRFRVVDLRSGSEERAQFVTAGSPEDADEHVVGEKAVRGHKGNRDLLCRVYWKEIRNTPNMVRLYRSVDHKYFPRPSVACRAGWEPIRHFLVHSPEHLARVDDAAQAGCSPKPPRAPTEVMTGGFFMGPLN